MLPYFKQGREPGARRRRLPRRRRPARRLRPARAAPSSARRSSRPRERRHSAQRRFQRRRQEGVGYYQTTTRSGRALQRRRGLSAPGARRAQPHGRHDALRPRALRGRRAAASSIGAAARPDGGRRGRGDRRRRRHQLAAAPAALRASARRSCCSALGIEVVADLPGVGEELQDHLQVRMIWRCSEPSRSTTTRELAAALGIGLRYALPRKGPLTISAGYAGAFVRTDAATGDARHPVSHFLHFSTTKMGERLHPFSGFTASSASCGRRAAAPCASRRADPAARPAIRLELSLDRDRPANDGGRAQAAAPRSAGAGARAATSPAKHDPGPRATATTICWLTSASAAARSITRPGPAAWARTPTAVVDARLRVRGVAGLRVVDASIMPSGRVRQHQRRHHHDRREGRRHDPRRCTPPTGAGARGVLAQSRRIHVHAARCGSSDWTLDESCRQRRRTC